MSTRHANQGHRATLPVGEARKPARRAGKVRRLLRMASLRSRRRLLHGLFTTAARFAGLSGDLRSARLKVDVLREVPYGPHPVAHRLDVYRPREAQGPLPVLLYIHGGAFVLCSKETHSGIALLNAAHAGYLVFNINYRLAPNHLFPAAIEDSCAAYAWVVEHAHRYGGDPSRIVVAGESAGGNLALGVAVANTYARPESYAARVFDLSTPPLGVMPLMPYLQASDPLHRSGAPAVGYFALSVAQDIALAYLGEDAQACDATVMADPIRVLEECGAPKRTFPSVFSAVGTADMCCSDTRRLERACLRLGLEIDAHYYENEVHAFHALHWRQAARRFWQESIGFLRSLALRPLAAPA